MIPENMVFQETKGSGSGKSGFLRGLQIYRIFQVLCKPGQSMDHLFTHIEKLIGLPHRINILFLIHCHCYGNFSGQQKQLPYYIDLDRSKTGKSVKKNFRALYFL